MTSRKKGKGRAQQPVCFWTEGTIEAIVVENPVRFLLSLSASVLCDGAEGKRALFSCDREDDDVTGKKAGRYSTAKLVGCVKNKAGKECLWFMGHSQPSPLRISPGLLLNAKNARTTIRVGIPRKEFAIPSRGVSCQTAFAVSRLMFV